MSKHLLAGATSGLISAVCLQPLDLIKVTTCHELFVIFGLSTLSFRLGYNSNLARHP